MRRMRVGRNGIMDPDARERIAEHDDIDVCHQNAGACNKECRVHRVRYRQNAPSGKHESIFGSTADSDRQRSLH